MPDRRKHRPFAHLLTTKIVEQACAGDKQAMADTLNAVRLRGERPITEIFSALTGKTTAVKPFPRRPSP